MWAEHHEKELYFTTAGIEKKRDKTLIRNIEKNTSKFPLWFYIFKDKNLWNKDHKDVKKLI